MQFYRFHIKGTGKIDDDSALKDRICQLVADAARGLGEDKTAFISDFRQDCLVCALSCQGDLKEARGIAQAIVGNLAASQLLDSTPQLGEVEAVTVSLFRRLCQSSDSFELDQKFDDALEEFQRSVCRGSMEEALFSSLLTKEEVLEKARHIAGFDELSGELERICSVPGRTGLGHPVHYVIYSSDNENARSLVSLLVSSLAGQGRLSGARAFFLDLGNDMFFDLDDFEASMSLLSGNAVVVDLRFAKGACQQKRLSGGEELVFKLGRSISRHRREVLLIAIVPPEGGPVDMLQYGAEGLNFLSFREGLIDHASALAFAQSFPQHFGSMRPSQTLLAPCAISGRPMAAGLMRSCAQGSTLPIRTSSCREWSARWSRKAWPR